MSNYPINEQIKTIEDRIQGHLEKVTNLSVRLELLKKKRGDTNDQD